MNHNIRCNYRVCYVVGPFCRARIPLEVRPTSSQGSGRHSDTLPVRRNDSTAGHSRRVSKSQGGREEGPPDQVTPGADLGGVSIVQSALRTGMLPKRVLCSLTLPYLRPFASTRNPSPLRKACLPITVKCCLRRSRVSLTGHALALRRSPPNCARSRGRRGRG